MTKYKLYYSTYNNGDCYPKATTTTEARTWTDLFDVFLRENPNLKESLSDGQLIVIKNESSNAGGLTVMRVRKGNIGIEPIQ